MRGELRVLFAQKSPRVRRGHSTLPLERPRDVLVVVEDGDRETAQERLAITCLMFVYSSTAYIDRSLP